MARPGIVHVVQRLSNLQLGHSQTWFSSSRDVINRATTPDSSSSDAESEITDEPEPTIVVSPPLSDGEQPPHPKDLMELADLFRIMGLSEADDDFGAGLGTRRRSWTPEEKVPLQSVIRRQHRVRRLRARFAWDVICRDRLRPLKQWCLYRCLRRGWDVVRLRPWWRLILLVWMQVSIVWVAWQVFEGILAGRDGVYVLRNFWRSLLVWLDDLLLGWRLLWGEAGLGSTYGN